MSDFLVSNRLKLNDDKIHLLVLTSSQTRKARRTAGKSLDVTISTPSTVIDATPSEKLLGGWIHQDVKWSEHILDGQESLVKSLNTRLSALKMIGKVASLRLGRRWLMGSLLANCHT